MIFSELNLKIEFPGYFIIVFFLVCSMNLFAQENISASGGNGRGTGGSISYTAGLVVYNTNKSVSGISVSEGMQQPYEIYINTNIENYKIGNFSCFVYPNPVQDFLSLEITNLSNHKLSYKIYGTGGNLLQSGKIVQRISVLPFGNLPGEIYVLNVFEKQRIVKSFNIIKNQ